MLYLRTDMLFILINIFVFMWLQGGGGIEAFFLLVYYFGNLVNDGF